MLQLTREPKYVMVVEVDSVPDSTPLYNVCFGRDACHHGRNKHHNNDFT